MGIKKGPARHSSGLKKHVGRCWDCDEQSAVLIIRPSDQRPICLTCTPRDSSVAEVPTRAKKA